MEKFLQIVKKIKTEMKKPYDWKKDFIDDLPDMMIVFCTFTLMYDIWMLLHK